jgi:hypothetical protein
MDEKLTCKKCTNRGVVIDLGRYLDKVKYVRFNKIRVF